MSQELPTTSYALLGLLAFGDDLSGYELKQRADRTLRFYWVSPAMSQVYTELTRLARLHLVQSRDDDRQQGRRTRRYRITAKGCRDLQRWLRTAPLEFPALKHPIALRLLLGHLVDPESSQELLRGYLTALQQRRAELQMVRDSLGADSAAEDPFRFARLVADWGLDYYDSEREIVSDLVRRIAGASRRAVGKASTPEG
ncbi:MAG: PadR family transcriptional regulator [Nocardioidaceae bacterium]